MLQKFLIVSCSKNANYRGSTYTNIFDHAFFIFSQYIWNDDIVHAGVFVMTSSENNSMVNLKAINRGP